MMRWIAVVVILTACTSKPSTSELGQAMAQLQILAKLCECGVFEARIERFGWTPAVSCQSCVGCQRQVK